MIFALARLTKRNETTSMREELYVCVCVDERERDQVKEGEFVPVFSALFIKGTVLAGDGFPHISCRNRNMQLL